MDQDEQKKSENEVLRDIASGAKTVATAAKTAGRAAAGDVAGAILDLLKDENVRRIICAILIGSIVLCIYGSMMMGSAITGTIEAIKRDYIAAYEQIYEDFAISTNGSTFALYTFNKFAAKSEALSIAIKNAVERFFKKTSPYSNSNLPSDSGTSVDNLDYQTSLAAIKDQEAFVGESGALQKRLDMIKGRVEQRGKQLAHEATIQYQIQAVGISIGVFLDNLIREPLLFAGVDLENSSLDIDTSVFEISDIQALKILAAYSVQNDCNVADIDMWDLMNYSGWYSLALEDLPVSDKKNTIYDSTMTASYGMEIGDVVQEGDVISYEAIGLAPPKVPYWDGSCAAQWYYEEIAQLRKNNETYAYYEETGNVDALYDMLRYVEDDEGNIDISKFEKLSEYKTFGLVDQIYTSSSANLVVTRTEYHGATEFFREAMAQLSGRLKEKWEDLFSVKNKRTIHGNRVIRDANGNHKFTLYTSNSNSYYLSCPSTGWRSGIRRGDPQSSITFTGLSGGTLYYVYEVKDDSASRIDSFTTFGSREDYQAYQIQLDIDVTYASRSVDEMIESVLGLWPGNLAETEVGSDGIEYADGYADNELLAKTWTDTYTGSGNHEITFARMTGYQAEAYEDYLMAIGEGLGLDMSGELGGYGDGQTMVDIAMQEYEYYTANNLYEGGRYWNMVKQATGVKYPDTTPWCVCFVMTCAWQIDLLGEGKAWAGVRWIYYCDGLYNELVNKGVATGYASRGSNYVPQPGDIVFFNQQVQASGLEHVGIVKEVTESGKLVTIEGNKSDRLKVCTYSSYKLGTYAYGNCVIAAYCNPTYPATFLEDPVYEKIYNSIIPSVNARIMKSQGKEVFLAGLGRFRWSQMGAVIAELKKSYPELYKSELKSIYEAGDMMAFADVWNQIANSSKKDKFRVAQRRILSQLYVQPIVTKIKADTGFDWKKTRMREDLILGIVTTTDQKDVCIAVLKAIAQDFNNSVSDNILLEQLYSNNKLYNTVSANRNSLWPEDPPAFRERWCTGIHALLKKLLEKQQEEDAA